MDPTIVLEPAPSLKQLTLNHCRYLLELATEIAEDLPFSQVFVRYGTEQGETILLQGRQGQIELF